MLWLIPALACSLGNGNSQTAGSQVSFGATPNSASTSTSLPVVEDVDRVRTETPQPTPTEPTPTVSSSAADTIIVPSGDEPSLAIGADADDDQQSDKDAGTNDNALNSNQITPTPTPTLTVTPTPAPVAVSSGWPPIMPNATGLNSGDRYVTYFTVSDSATVTDFYRREMPRYGRVEIDFGSLLPPGALAGLSGLEDFGSDAETILTFSQDGGNTLAFVLLSAAGGQVKVGLIWPP